MFGGSRIGRQLEDDVRRENAYRSAHPANCANCVFGKTKDKIISCQRFPRFESKSEGEKCGEYKRRWPENY